MIPRIKKNFLTSKQISSLLVNISHSGNLYLLKRFEKMILMFAFVFLFISLLSTNVDSLEYDRPIIGVLAEEVNSTFVPNAKSAILASYVKYLESGGARVIPVWIHKSQTYYEDIMSKINGVLFPGGGGILFSSGYGRTARLIFDIATKMNDKGDFFPLWGTCLGFELLHYLAVKKLWMKTCAAEDLATNIKLVKDFRNSRMFEDLEPLLASKMQKQNSVIHYHQWCLTPENYTKSGLDKYFKVLAYNQDSRNMTFVSIVEAYKYPFYGVSFHPEKTMFEWVLSKTHHNIPHNKYAIQASQYFANFFINEARKSYHHFPSKEAEDDILIYNYNPIFTGKHKNNPTEQKYYFMQ